ncbi:hypothetical protein K402DRAFT_464985 [Aulographum hederae CBS 113979]|uniref:Uncharacterized protein n=1 Tax=Aulographum hederae CBS 113979 TaxID=1176131 RepID=A0A6G1GUW4_9PEZI|nr:hypothetical protein K402DRAFT_464985 [Aulographum hederae CBS 113979]
MDFPVGFAAIPAPAPAAPPHRDIGSMTHYDRPLQLRAADDAAIADAAVDVPEGILADDNQHTPLPRQLGPIKLRLKAKSKFPAPFLDWLVGEPEILGVFSDGTCGNEHSALLQSQGVAVGHRHFLFNSKSNPHSHLWEPKWGAGSEDEEEWRASETGHVWQSKMDFQANERRLSRENRDQFQEAEKVDREDQAAHYQHILNLANVDRTLREEIFSRFFAIKNFHFDHFNQATLECFLRTLRYQGHLHLVERFRFGMYMSTKELDGDEMQVVRLESLSHFLEIADLVGPQIKYLRAHKRKLLRLRSLRAIRPERLAWLTTTLWFAGIALEIQIVRPRYGFGSADNMEVIRRGGYGYNVFEWNRADQTYEPVSTSAWKDFGLAREEAMFSAFTETFERWGDLTTFEHPYFHERNTWTAQSERYTKAIPALYPGNPNFFITNVVMLDDGYFLIPPARYPDNHPLKALGAYHFRNAPDGSKKWQLFDRTGKRAPHDDYDPFQEIGRPAPQTLFLHKQPNLQMSYSALWEICNDCFDVFDSRPMVARRLLAQGFSHCHVMLFFASAEITYGPGWTFNWATLQYGPDLYVWYM